MNASNQNSKPTGVDQPRSDSSRKNKGLSALRNPPDSLRWMMWLAGFVLVFYGTSLVGADFLPNNFWPDSTFENGTNLDQTDGTLANWNRGGTDTTICQVITYNFVSLGHSLACIDANGRVTASGTRMSTSAQ